MSSLPYLTVRNHCCGIYLPILLLLPGFPETLRSLLYATTPPYVLCHVLIPLNPPRPRLPLPIPFVTDLSEPVGTL